MVSWTKKHFKWFAAQKGCLIHNNGHFVSQSGLGCSQWKLNTLSQLPCCQLSPRALPCFSPCLQCTGRMRRRWDNEELVTIVIEILPCQVSLSRAFAQSHSNEPDATTEMRLKSLSNNLVLVSSIYPFLHQLCQKWAFLSLNFCCLGSFAHFLWSRAAC